MYQEFSNDPINLTAAAVTVAQAADKLKQIGDSCKLNLWPHYVLERELVPVFWPYLIAEVNKLSQYKDFKAEIIHEHSYTAIKMTYITAKQSKDVIEQNKARQGE